MRFAGNLALFGETTGLALFAGLVGAVFDASFVFAFLTGHTDDHIFAFTPGIAGTAGLRPFATDFSSDRSADALRIGFADFTAVDDADRLVRKVLCTLFIGLAFHTALFACAVLSLWAVFFRPTDTLIVTCTLFGRTCFGLTLCIS